MKSINSEPIYKSGIPFVFYIYRVFVIGCAIPVVIMAKNDYALMFFIIFIAFILTTNKYFFVIKMYEDKFTITTPSFYVRVLDDVDEFYFDNISEFEYFRRDINLKTIAFGLIANEVGRAGMTRGFSQPAVIRFKNNPPEGEQTAEYTFRRSTESVRTGLEMLEKRILEENHKNDKTKRPVH